MKQSILVALVVFFGMSHDGFAFASPPDMANAWEGASIVALGTVNEFEGVQQQGTVEEGRYVMKVEKTYKGEAVPERLEFIDPYSRTDSSLGILEGKRFLVFLQTAEDRKKLMISPSDNLGATLSALRAFPVRGQEIAAIEEAIKLIQTYQNLRPGEQKEFLLKNLSVQNPYVRTMIDFEVILARITEAIPYYQNQLSRATEEGEKMRYVSAQRILGAPGVKEILIACLTDDSIKSKTDIFEEIVRLQDKTVIPELRKWINDQDDVVAVSARSALHRLGEKDTTGLLLEMIHRSKDPVARYNAIHYLNWFDHQEPFTDAEKAAIEALVNDEEESVARVAGFITQKWKAMPVGESE